MTLADIANAVSGSTNIDFIGIDTETANSSRSSLCSIGIAVVADGQVVSEAEQVIDPECEFALFNTKVHGIDANLVAGAPTLPQVWGEVMRTCEGQRLIFHNAAFDMGVLRASAARYELPGFTGTVTCTMRLARRVWPTVPGYGLGVLAPRLGIDFDHHQAGSDASACAAVALAMIKDQGCTDLDSLHLALDSTPGRVSNEAFVGMTVPTQGSLANRAADPGANPDSPLHGLTVCFTGTLLAMIRRDAADLVCESGGEFVVNMSKKVDLLVVGDGDYIAFADGHQTGKLTKAAKLRADGEGPEIVREAEFFHLLRG